MKQQVGKFIVELSSDILMIKNTDGELIKGEAVQPIDGEDKFKQLCIDLQLKIADRTEKGLNC